MDILKAKFSSKLAFMNIINSILIYIKINLKSTYHYKLLCRAEICQDGPHVL